MFPIVIIKADENDIFEAVIKVATIFVAFYAARGAFYAANYTKIKNKYELFDSIYNDFLGANFLRERRKVTEFWAKLLNKEMGKLKPIEKIWKANNKRLKLFLRENFTRFPEPFSIWPIGQRKTNLTLLTSEYDELLTLLIKKHDQEVRATEAVLNKYEHLAKLVELKIIRKKDLKVLFYTMLGDTFLICLPFIMYRINTKPVYAAKMQKLIKVLPNFSSDLRRV